MSINKEDFIKLYAETKSISEVSRRLGIGKTTAYRYRKKNNIQIIKYKMYESDDDYFAQNTEGSFYWAGFIAADGCVMNKKRDYTFVLKVSLANKDIDHLRMFNRHMKSTYPVKKYPNYCELAMYSRKICDDLRRFNIVPRKTHIYTMPKWVRDHKLVNHFIRGYFDGDGSLSKYKQKSRNIPQHMFSVRGTKPFLTDMYKIIDKNCQLYYDRKVSLSGGIHQVGYSGNKVVKKICEYLYKDGTIYLTRKRQRANVLLKQG